MKTYSTDLQDAFKSDKFFAVDLVELHLKNSAGSDVSRYYSNGGFDIKWDSPTAPTSGVNTYTPQGGFLGFSSVSEEFDVKVGKFSLFLSGLTLSGGIDGFWTTGQEGKRVVIYKAFLDLNDGSIIDTPIVMFDGIIYNISIVEQAQTCSITIDCATLFADFERTAGRKTNNASNWSFQGSTYDTSMEKSGYTANTEYKWGKL